MKLWIIAIALIVCTPFAWVQQPRKPKPTQHQAECSADDIMGTAGGSVYQCVDGKAVIDAKRTAENRDYLEKLEAKRKALVWALATRLLTQEEMKEVEKQGMYILVPTNGVYSGDIQREFNDLMYQQFRFRALADNPCGPSNTRFTSDPVRSNK